MTKLSKTSKESEHIFAAVSQIESIAVDGNTTHMQVKISMIVDEYGECTYDKVVMVEIPTLDLIETFNTTWTNHAIGKLKHWINQLSK